MLGRMTTSLLGCWQQNDDGCHIQAEGAFPRMAFRIMNQKHTYTRRALMLAIRLAVPKLHLLLSYYAVPEKSLKCMHPQALYTGFTSIHMANKAKLLPFLGRRTRLIVYVCCLRDLYDGSSGLVHSINRGKTQCLFLDYYGRHAMRSGQHQQNGRQLSEIRCQSKLGQ